MKKCFLLTLISFIFTLGTINAQVGDDEVVYNAVDEIPRFPGCEQEMDPDIRDRCSMDSLMNYLIHHIQYPEEAKADGIQGTGVVQFIVSKDGRLEDVRVVRSLSNEIDLEMIRVIESMPTWIPGKLGDMPVNTMFTLPIKFRLPKTTEE